MYQINDTSFNVLAYFLLMSDKDKLCGWLSEEVKLVGGAAKALCYIFYIVILWSLFYHNLSIY
jgi:hypothetical protein